MAARKMAMTDDYILISDNESTDDESDSSQIEIPRKFRGSSEENKEKGGDIDNMFGDLMNGAAELVDEDVGDFEFEAEEIYNASQELNENDVYRLLNIHNDQVKAAAC